MIGNPPCSHVVPLTVDKVPEELQSAGDDHHSPLCDEVVKRKHQVFSITRGSGSHYIDMELLKTIMKEQIPMSLENYKAGYQARENKAKSIQK